MTLMTEYIERDAAREKCCSLCRWEGTENCEECEHPIDDIPAADVVPVRKGRWIDTDPDTPNWSNRKAGMSFYCSACGHPAGKHKHSTYKFCPWCGALMDKDGDRDE